VLAVLSTLTLLTLLTIFPTTLEVLVPTPERPAPTPPPQVMTYFKQLTGSKLPKPIAKKFKVGNNKFEYGVIYKIKTDKGYFTLRNKLRSK
jgi:hypothetical protein